MSFFFCFPQSPPVAMMSFGWDAISCSVVRVPESLSRRLVPRLVPPLAATIWPKLEFPKVLPGAWSPGARHTKVTGRSDSGRALAAAVTGLTSES